MPLPTVRFCMRMSDQWSWDRVGREFLKAFIEAGFPTKAMPTVFGDLTGPEWDEVREAFSHIVGLGKDEVQHAELIPGQYLNVVCGFADDFEKYWTKDVLANIAITACHPRTFSEADKAGVAKYDLILTFAGDLVLMQLDFPELYEQKKIEPVKAKPGPLKFVLQRFLEQRNTP